MRTRIGLIATLHAMTEAPELFHPGIHAAVSPDKIAYVLEPSGVSVTYGELEAASNQIAHLLRDAGLQRGDHISFVMENHRLYFALCWGAHRAGLYYTAMSSRLGTEETSYIVNNSQSKVFIASSYKREVAESIVAETPNVTLRLMVDGTIDGYESLEDAMERYPTTPIADESEGSDMLYSSGTTGMPKGVLTPLTEGPFGTAPGLLTLVSLLYGFSPDTVYLSPAPLYHAAPLRFCLSVQRLGGTVVVMERFDPEFALELIEKHRVTTSQWVPTMFVRMFKLDPSIRTKYDLSSHRTAIHAAAPCPKEVKKALIEWWGAIVYEYYAGSEGNGFVQCNSEQWLAHEGTVGTPLNATIHICDEDGTELPAGEPGTIYFESAARFEYHGDKEKTRGSRHPDHDSWSTLGDIGFVDADNFLYLTDRKAFMIISGGVNVYPQEAENRLIMHPAVMDAAVFGVPNEDFGEEVKAVVQPIDMASATPELERELIAYCREALADVKCPRSIDFRPELPRHPTGKLYKRLLKDEYWAAAGRSI